MTKNKCSYIIKLRISKKGSWSGNFERSFPKKWCYGKSLTMTVEVCFWLYQRFRFLLSELILTAQNAVGNKYQYAVIMFSIQRILLFPEVKLILHYLLIKGSTAFIWIMAAAILLLKTVCYRIVRAEQYIKWEIK